MNKKGQIRAQHRTNVNLQGGVPLVFALASVFLIYLGISKTPNDSNMIIWGAISGALAAYLFLERGRS